MSVLVHVHACVCKLLILLCCQINVFKSFRAKRGRGHFPLPHPPPFGDPRPLWVHNFFFRTPPFPDLATGLTHDLHAKARVIECGDKLFVKDTSSSKEWDSGVVIEVNGSIDIHSQGQDGCILHQHIDHIRKRQSADTEQVDTSFSAFPGSGALSLPSLVVSNPGETLDIYQS